MEGGSGGVGGAGGELDKNGLYSEPFHLTYSSMGAYSTLGRKLVHANPLSSPDYTGEWVKDGVLVRLFGDFFVFSMYTEVNGDV